MATGDRKKTGQKKRWQSLDSRMGADYLFSGAREGTRCKEHTHARTQHLLGERK